LHFRAQAASHATLQQYGEEAQTQVSQVQAPHPLPATALQPLWLTVGMPHVPLMHWSLPVQWEQVPPDLPQSAFVFPDMQVEPEMHPLQQVPLTQRPSWQGVLSLRLNGTHAPVVQLTFLHGSEGLHGEQFAPALPQ